jgi:hypothetical protein
MELPVPQHQQLRGRNRATTNYDFTASAGVKLVALILLLEEDTHGPAILYVQARCDAPCANLEVAFSRKRNAQGKKRVER